MKIREIMTEQVVRIHPEENVAVAARLLTHYNVGSLPVMGSNGRLQGLVTDRDIVTRCLASGKQPEGTTVAEVMTRNVIAVRPDMDAADAAAIMGAKQVRRLPVMENGKLCGMVSLGDLSGRTEVEEALTEISNNLSKR